MASTSRSSTLRTLALVVAGGFSSGQVLSSGFSSAATGIRPEGVSKAIAASLLPEAIRVADDRGEAAIFWIRESVPTAVGGTSAASPLLRERIAAGGIEPGALLGVVTFRRRWIDYRNFPVDAGTYTLRYAVQPAIKEHRGVSRYRDFVALVPVSSDPGLELALPEVIARSEEGARRGHPAVMALFPLEPSVRPGTITSNEIGQPVLAISAGSATLGIVLEGHGEIPEGE
jgi:hypothetical protein